jgi:hypothetical protein
MHFNFLTSGHGVGSSWLGFFKLKKPSIYRGDPGFHDISSRALLERVWVYQTYANMIFFSRKLKMLVSRCIEEVERTVKPKGLLWSHFPIPTKIGYCWWLHATQWIIHLNEANLLVVYEGGPEQTCRAKTSIWVLGEVAWQMSW